MSRCDDDVITFAKAIDVLKESLPLFEKFSEPTKEELESMLRNAARFARRQFTNNAEVLDLVPTRARERAARLIASQDTGPH